MALNSDHAAIVRQSHNTHVRSIVSPTAKILFFFCRHAIFRFCKAIICLHSVIDKDEEYWGKKGSIQLDKMATAAAPGYMG